MEKKKISKLISILMIVFLVFQLIPCTLSSAEDFQNNTQTSNEFLASSPFISDATFIGRENQKTLYQKLPAKNPSANVSSVFSAVISLNNSFFPEEPFDYRRVIRQSIPHYFNGSKYKNNHFVI